MSSTLYDLVTTTGVIVPDTSTIKAQVQAEYIAAFGSALDIDDSSPAGVMIAMETLSRTTVINNNANIANQINPNLAGGIFLDAILALTGAQRDVEVLSSYPSVTLSGQPNLPVPAGTLIENSNQDVFTLTAAVTLSSSGQGVGSFVATTNGPISAPAGPFNLLSGVLGLTTINSALAGVVGTTALSDVAARGYRRQTLALQGRSTNAALMSAVTNLSFVVDCVFLENNTNEAVVIDGISLVATSFWFCINDGLAGASISDAGENVSALASTILQYKGQGANWNGVQTGAATDPVTGQLYTVKWDIPIAVQIGVQITVLQGSYTGDIVSAVKNAILNYASNSVGDGIQGIATGQNISPFEIASAVTFLVQGAYVRNVQIATPPTGGTFASAEIAIPKNHIASILAANIDVILATS